MVPFFKIQEYPKLAIVIPAFKKTFLKDALTSIAEQTNQEFKVYIGDDASPENLEEICAPFANQISLTYIKFDENIGSTSLVEHWARCIEMANEPWIWLFCDDDRMDSDCVDLFYTALKTTKEKFNLYRFNTSVINANNTIIKQRSNHPVVETGLSFAYYRLAGVRESYVTEYIFRKSTFDENSGFISFPAAWCSDDATWITLAGDKGIFTIEGPVVYWRKSRENIGGHNLFFKKEKLKAAVFFLDWFFAKYERQIKNSGSAINHPTLLSISKKWLAIQALALCPLGPWYWVFLPHWPKVFGSRGTFTGRLLLVYLDFRFAFGKAVTLIKKALGA